MLQKLGTVCLIVVALFIMVVGIAQPADAQSLPTPYQFYGNNTNSNGTPPPAPILSSPANNAAGVATTLTLQWNASQGATSYLVQVSISDNFNSTIFNQSDIAATQVTVSALNASTTYYWRVRASNSSGDSDWSTTWSFTTCAPPPAPTLSSPANNATGVAIAPNLRWNASSGATSYQVQVSTASDFNTTIFNQSNITATQVTVSPALNANTIYYWRVKASNSAGNSDWSSVWIFATGTPPPVPILSSPGNNTTGAATAPDLQWNASSGATSYQVQVSIANDFNTTIFNQSNITAIQITVSPALNANTIYYWRVRASNSAGNRGWSTTWSFTTGVLLSTPTLSSPANNAAGAATAPNLQWNASPGATSYQVQVSTASDFNTTIFNQSNVTTTQVTVSPALNANTIYYWRVKASSSSSNSDWSATWSLTTGATISAPTLSSPANNTIKAATAPDLQWNASSGATSYQVQVSTASDFNTTIFNQSNITTTQVTVSPALNANTIYYWRVKASNDSGASDWSTTWSFTTEAPQTITINTNVIGQTGSFSISTSGVLSTATTLSSADSGVQLSLNANTTVTIQGQSLTVVTEAAPPATPANAKLINAYNLGPNNTTFSPAITLTLKYDSASLPQGVTESDLYIAFWAGTAWTEMLSVVNTQNKTVSAQVSHFTIFALLGRTSETPTPPPPAGFSVSDLKISPTSVNPGKRVTITATITNDSDSKGSYNVVLKINGANEAEKEVPLKSKEAKKVSFTVSKEAIGDYDVMVGDQSSSFKVNELAARTGKSLLSIVGTIALALGGLFVIIFAIIFARRLVA
ncbi:MAG: hypothetical protein FJ006_08340 [Chloroflexi bacterium]|nr:hypothetical protein [Chloroflexota bacterium]